MPAVKNGSAIKLNHLSSIIPCKEKLSFDYFRGEEIRLCIPTKKSEKQNNNNKTPPQECGT